MKSAHALLAAIAAFAGTPLAAQEIAETRASRIDAADDARAAGEFDSARQILLNLLTVSPRDPDLLRRLAMVEAAEGRLDAAFERIESASRLAPDDLDIALARAYILYWRGDIDAARAGAAAIAEREADYPELAELSIALRAQNVGNVPRLRAISIGGGLSSISLRNGAIQTWNSQNLIVAADLSRNTTATLAAMREERSVTDVRLSARLDRRMGNGSVYVTATGVHDSDFQEDWSISTGGEVTATRNLALLADFRLAEYNTGTIAAFQPGLRVAFGPNLSLTGRAINLFGGGDDYRLGGSIRMDYRVENARSLFVIAASYPDAEADGVRQLRSLAAGFAFPLSTGFALSAAASYENRDNSYRRWSGTIGLTHRFGQR